MSTTVSNHLWYCPKCYLPYDAKDAGTDARLCKCRNESTHIVQGWQCPACGKVHAPFVAGCDCHVRTAAASAETYNYPQILQTFFHVDLDELRENKGKLPLFQGWRK